MAQTTTQTTTRFWLIRHGEPVEEARHRCYGSLDIELSHTGRDQMKQTAECLKTEPIAAIYTSPLKRAADSAAILATAIPCPVHTNPDLREIDFGDFEGLTYQEISARYPETWQQWMDTPTEVRFPNGETFAQMQARVLRAFEAIQSQHENQTIAIVSHGGVNRILIAWALNMPNHSLFRLAQDYAAINLIEMNNAIPTLRLLNRTAIQK